MRRTATARPTSSCPKRSITSMRSTPTRPPMITRSSTAPFAGRSGEHDAHAPQPPGPPHHGPRRRHRLAHLGLRLRVRRLGREVAPMSTRCQIEFRSGSTRRTVYRHWDGYPSAVIPDLLAFLAWSTRRGDVEYETANFLYWS